MTESVVGAVVNFVGEKLLQCIAEPIKRRYNYLRCYKSNIEKLREEARNLEDARDELQMRVTIAKNNAEEIVPAVETWFEDVNKIIEKKTGIETEITNIPSGCFAVKSRLSLSAEAENIAGDMKELQDRYRNFSRISTPALPASMALVQLGPTFDFQSRKHIEEDIVKALREFNMVGICGMGGVGKTTMAKRIMNRVKKEGLFDEIVIVVVSQNKVMFDIQDEIAGSLGLKLEEKGLQSRAHLLRIRLTEKKCSTGSTDEKTSTDKIKRILIVLDDVWEYLDLKEIGIPCEKGLQGCKILLTSRDTSVLNRMESHVCQIQILHEEEAWSLFKETVGPCVDDQNLQSIAQDICNECKGLPIALVTVGGALNNQEEQSVWEDAFSQLKSSNPTNVSGVLKHVYKPLELSYNFLESDEAKTIFLLCSLFPEDHNIPLEDLAVYAMGLRMFGDIRNLIPARNRIDTLVETLKRRFLLLEGTDRCHVRMHDVVRDVAILIASEEKRIKCSDCTWISPFLGERIELSTESFPNLRLLLVDKSADDSLIDESIDDISVDESSDDKLQLDNEFFEGKKELNVLYMKYYSLTSLPSTIDLLKNLRTLILDSCKSLETISVVGELLNLETLICRYCSSIKELPVEIGGLKCLRSLEISNCRSLEKIMPEVIKKLKKLEELKMVKSFKKWEAKDNNGKDRNNVTLSELQSLSNLTCLEIEVEDYTLAAEDIHLSPKIRKFNIKIGNCSCNNFKDDRGSENKLDLHLPREITLGSWILKFLRSCKCMRCEGQACNLELGEALKNVRSLTVLSSMVKKLANITSSSIDDARPGNTTIVFTHLESLELHELINLEEIFHIDGLIPDKAFGSNISFRFPNLKILKLEYLPNLTTLCKGIKSIEFPLLAKIYIFDCPQLRSLVSSTPSSRGYGNNQKNSGDINHDHDNDVSSYLICEPEKVAFVRHQILMGSFAGLDELIVEGCDKIRNLFSFSIAQNLIKLRVLVITRCLEMAKVIEEDQKEEEDTCCDDKKICLLPKLERLYLRNQPNLKCFCERKCVLELPSLESVEIVACPKMERFSLASLITPKLKSIYFEEEVEKNDQEEMSFCRWEAKLKGKETVHFWSHLGFAQAISFLSSEDSSLGSEQIIIPSNAGKHDNTIDGPRDFRFSCVGLEKIMHLCLPREIILENWIHQCVRSVDYMLLEGEGSKILDLKNAQNMRLLILKDWSGVQKFENIIAPLIDDGRCFPHLEYLELENLANLEEICDIVGRISINFFKNLKLLGLKCLPALKHLLANDCLLQLERLQIEKCEMLEQIFLWNEEEEENKRDIGHESRQVIFPKLKCLWLGKLPNLTTFCRGIEKIEFPLLTNMVIENCPNLKCFVSTATSSGCGNSQNNLGGITRDGVDDDDSLYLFCRQDKVVFGSLNKLWITNTSILGCDQIPIDFFARLESLVIKGCGGISSLFLSSAARNLVSLRKLEIWGSEKMVKVIEDDNKEDGSCGGGETTPLFPKLEDLSLIDLPNLKSFCEWRCALELPSLRSVSIYNCPEIERFSLGSLTTPNLKEEIRGHSRVIVNTDEDLNGALQRRLSMVKEQEKKEKMEEEKWKKMESEGEQREEKEEKEEEREGEQKIEIEDEVI